MGTHCIQKQIFLKNFGEISNCKLTPFGVGEEGVTCYKTTTYTLRFYVNDENNKLLYIQKQMLLENPQKYLFAKQ